MVERTILLSLAALALGAAACGGPHPMQPQNPSNVAKAMPSSTDLDTSSVEAPEWGMPFLTPAQGASGCPKTEATRATEWRPEADP